MSLDRRNCISHNESMANLPTQYHPQYYKFYRREGCIIECRAKYSMNKCGCLPYYYPQFEKDAYCNSTGLKCLASISGIFDTSIIVSGCLAYYLCHDNPNIFLILLASFYALSIGDGHNSKYFNDGASCECPFNCDESFYHQV